MPDTMQRRCQGMHRGPHRSCHLNHLPKNNVLAKSCHHFTILQYGPRQANLVLIAYASMRAAKIQASLRIRAVSPEPSLLTHTSSVSRETFRQKARSLAPLNGWACAIKICHDGMLEDTNSLDGARMVVAHCFLMKRNEQFLWTSVRIIRCPF